MEYRNIPDTDLTPSVLCLGSGPFGSDLDARVSFFLLDTYFEGGGNFIDTYASQARGFLTRLAKSGAEGLPGNLKKNYINEENLEKMFRLKVVSKETGYRVGEIVLSYLLSQPFPTFPIGGSLHQTQLKENLGAADKYLEPSLLKFLEG